MSRHVSLVTTALLAIAIALGIFARIHDIATKSFFSDESFSVLRITGHTEAELRALVDGRVHPIAALDALQRPDANTSVGATLKTIASEEPQRGPLYYSAATVWLHVAGTSIAGLRSLAVLVGILTIGAAYLFGASAFASRFAGFTLAALVAVSPFHFAYARQTREYGLFSFDIFLSASALLWALRGDRSTVRWLAVAASCAAGMLTTPFFALVLVSYALYACARGVRTSQRLRSLVPFVSAMAAALVLAAPWYVYIARNATRVQRETAWGASVYPVLLYLEKLVFETGAVFFDYEFAKLSFALAAVAVLAVAAYLTFSGIRSKHETVTIAIALALPTALVIVCNDLRIGAHFATIARYVTPVWIALEIVVTAGIVGALARIRETKIALGSLAIVVAAGVFCLFADRPYQEWWDNNDNVPIAAIGEAANAYPAGVLVASKLPLALALTHYLKPTLRVQLYRDDKAPALDLSANRNMLLVPTPFIKAAIAAGPSVSGMTQIVTQGTGNIVQSFHANLLKSKDTPKDVGYDFLTASNALWVVTRKD